GPDDAGCWSRPGVALVHRRLAVIDPTPSARQPMANDSGTIQVAFNGEIYNFRELRNELERGGARFRTHSDTEVIVRGYERWGDDVLTRVNGMFAIAIWDEAQQRALLARDRLGEKPLYYYADAKQFCFASEIKGLLVVPGVPREADPDAIDQYLTYQYVPGPATAFRGIYRVPPAHRVVVT